MIIRQSLNFAVHLAAGAAVGALLVVLAQQRRQSSLGRYEADYADIPEPPQAPAEET